MFKPNQLKAQTRTMHILGNSTRCPSSQMPYLYKMTTIYMIMMKLAPFQKSIQHVNVSSPRAGCHLSMVNANIGFAVVQGYVMACLCFSLCSRQSGPRSMYGHTLLLSIKLSLFNQNLFHLHRKINFQKLLDSISCAGSPNIGFVSYI